MDKLIEGLGTLLGFIIFTLILKWWEHRQEKQKEIQKKKSHSAEFTIDITRDVKHENRKIRDRHQAMRVYIIELSNGTIAESGLPLFEISFKHEVVLDYQVHVEALSSLFQKIPMPEMFQSPMNITFKTGEFYLKDREELLKSSNINQRQYYDWLKAYGVGSTMWLAIRKKDRPVAILVCHWPRPTDLDGTIIARIKDINRNIEKIYTNIK